MRELWIAASFALLLTLIFAFRHSKATEPKRLALYFGVLFSVELGAEKLLLPPDALPIEIAIVCTILCIPFGALVYLSRKYPDAGHPRR